MHGSLLLPKLFAMCYTDQSADLFTLANFRFSFYQVLRESWWQHLTVTGVEKDQI
jgi:hypothetical protein